jgi:Raf kinase inhibitor-like YbhB/YbcL family protein
MDTDKETRLGIGKAALVALSLLALLLSMDAAANQQKGGKAMAFEVKSAAFAQGADIPRKFTCDGQDVSPELSWKEPPKSTQSFALIVDDPDAPVGTWMHWVLYDLPGTTRSLPEGVPKERELASGARQGNNGWNRTGYGGPCPPPGPAHRYFFKLYALDSKTNLKPGATKAELEKAMQGHILAQAELMGRYKR